MAKRTLCPPLSTSHSWPFSRKDRCLLENTREEKVPWPSPRMQRYLWGYMKELRLKLWYCKMFFFSRLPRSLIAHIPQNTLFGSHIFLKSSYESLNVNVRKFASAWEITCTVNYTITRQVCTGVNTVWLYLDLHQNARKATLWGVRNVEHVASNVACVAHTCKV